MFLSFLLKIYSLEGNCLSQNTLINSGGIRRAKLLSWLQIEGGREGGVGEGRDGIFGGGRRRGREGGGERGEEKGFLAKYFSLEKFLHIISISMHFKPFLLHCAHFTNVRVRSHCNRLLAPYLQVPKLGTLIEWIEEQSYIRRVYNTVTINESKLQSICH